MDLDNLFIAIGGPIKALGNGEVEGYGVSFGSETRRDLYGQFFTKSGPGDATTTYYGSHKLNGVDVFVHHGMVLTTGQESKEEIDILKRFARTRLNPVKTVEDETGLIARVILDMRNEYESMLYDMAGRNALSFSSGALGHIIDIEENGHIKTWIGAEMSFTPTPAEWRSTNIILPAKSFIKEIGAELVSVDSYRRSFPSATPKKVVTDEQPTAAVSAEKPTAPAIKTEVVTEPLPTSSMAIKASLLGDSAEVMMTMAAISRIEERLYSAIWTVIYGPNYDGQSSEPIPARLDLIAAYIDEFKSLVLNFAAVGMTLSTSEAAAAKSFMDQRKALYEAIRAGEVLSSQNKSDLNSAIDLIQGVVDRASSSKSGSSKSVSLLNEVEQIKSALTEHVEQYEIDQCRELKSSVKATEEKVVEQKPIKETSAKTGNLSKLLASKKA